MVDGFARLVEDALRARAARDPAWASLQGLREYDAQVADPRPDAFREEVGSLRGFLRRLDHVDAPRGDGNALRVALHARIHELEEVRAWARDPDLAREFLDHLLPLVICERPPAERVDALAARLRAAPAFLEEGRDRFQPEEVPSLWIDAAVETVASAPAFLETVRRSVKAHGDRTLSEAFRTAEAALADHGRWLQAELRPVATGHWALGEEGFDRLLAARRIPYDATQAAAFADNLLASFRKQTEDAARSVLAEHGKSLAREDVTAAAERIVQTEHPVTFAEALVEFSREIRAARAFVHANQLADVPPESSLQVIETPAHLRHLLPFGGYVPPGRFDPHARGTCFVTPKMDLAGFSAANLRNAAARFAYPGRHLQAWHARDTHPARGLSDAWDLLQGWPIYSEALMGRHGFTAQPEEHFMRAQDAVRAAAFALLDVQLHTERVGLDEAVNRLSRVTGISRMEAVTQVRCITRAPGRALGALVGRVRLDDLRERALASGLPERLFHERVLRAGGVPIALLENEGVTAPTPVG